MDDQKTANDGNEQGLNKIDLTQLQDFTFGTQWTEIKQVAPSRREHEGDRGERRDRRDDRGPGGEPKRDRRTFRKPAGAPGGPAPSGPGESGMPPRMPPGERGFAPDHRPRGEGFRGGPRRDFRGDWRERSEGAPYERAPYVSPYFNITCYPEDAGFAAMVKAVRASCRTFQLFEITKAVLEKNERFVVVIQRKPDGAPRGPAAATPAPDAAPERRPEEAPPAKLAPLFMAVPDHLPFETEDAAIQHVLKNHLALFFDVQDVEVDPPKGNFPIINKCGITGELLGPPNYHRYQQTLQQHYASRLTRMPFERFRDGIVSVREPEVIQQWLDKMKKATRYTWKTAATKPAIESIPPFSSDASSDAAAPVVPEAPAAAGAGPESTDAQPAASAPVITPPAPPAEAPASAPAAPVKETAPSFDSLEEARAHLLATAKDKVVRAVETVRFHGKLVEKMPAGEARRAIEGHVERQRRFPLDTANALRGRLRREGFTIFKKGSRGVSYVCAVKRRFRVPGQVFSESITALIDFLEKNPMMPVKELPLKFLGIDLAAALAATPPPEGASQSQAPFAVLPPEQAEKLRKMNNDLRWLVTEGYVTEFSDSKLFASPAVVPQALKRAGEHGEEHDPVDFPEAPPAGTATAPAANAPASAQPTSVEAVSEPEAHADGVSGERPAEGTVPALTPAPSGSAPAEPEVQS